MKSLLLLLLFMSHVLGQFEGDPCVRNFDGKPGICMHYRKCTKVGEDLKRGIEITTCSFISNAPIVCCPTEGPPNRVSVQKCENYTELTKDKIFLSNLDSITVSNCDLDNPLIIGGEEARKGEFPHMAALGYTTQHNTTIFLCGGSLISEKFVLTAAHCGKFSEETLTMVRLGDNHLERESGSTSVDVTIEAFIPHEQFSVKSYYFDIALVRLSQNVNFTKFIRPACLWQMPIDDITKVIATGWGKTEQNKLSNKLMKVGFDIINNSQCNSNIKKDKRLNSGIIDSQMCAGVLEQNKDICSGDSGGPIQVANPSNICLYYVIGITSFGQRHCGIKNATGIYTRVSSFLDWIEEKVWQ